MERTERTQERTNPLFPPAFQALSKYYWRELLHLSSAVDQKAQRGVSDDYRKILALLKMLGWRILQGFQSLFHFLKKHCFHRLLREYPTDSLL